jgi:predicted ATPase
MRVHSFRVVNFRSFQDSGLISLAPINILIGANNAGKSSLLRALHLLQQGGQMVAADVRVGTPEYEVEINLENVGRVPKWQAGDETAKVSHQIKVSTLDRKSMSCQWSVNIGGPIFKGSEFTLSNIEPQHFVVPYLSRRKTGGYSEDVREQAAMTMSIDMSNLAAKLTRIGNPYFPNHPQYAQSCLDILGFVVTSIPSPNGQRPVVYLPSREAIDIDFMGEGVPNIVQLLVNLAVSEGKLFLMEEPENDIHPQALRSLLDLIVASSSKNQFVILTHSNIVVSHLCSTERGKLFKIASQKGALPSLSMVNEVEASRAARLQTLTELGYSFADLGLWGGYLILEESSAECIIRTYLIPYFAPSLSRIRTISAGGVGNVEPTFSDLNRLTLFLHLEPAYQNKTWVIVDGDGVGKAAIEKLCTRYREWLPGSFESFAEPQFEWYYPACFATEVEEILAVSAADKRREKKAALLQRVIRWLDEDSARARDALAISANDVIQHLQRIELAFASAHADA